MSQSPSPPSALTAPTVALLAAIGTIMENLKVLIATRFLKIPLLYPLITPLWKRLNRIHRRLKRALELGIALPRMQTSRAGQPRPRRATTAIPPLPQKFGWLIVALGWQAAGYAGHLEHLFSKPEIMALVAACPRARRVLRPVARMLALRIFEPVKPAPASPPQELCPEPPPDHATSPGSAAATSEKIKKPV